LGGNLGRLLDILSIARAIPTYPALRAGTGLYGLLIGINLSIL